MEHMTIYRYGPPTKYDHAPYGSVCICTLFTANGHKETKYYQTSKDEENPSWEEIE